MRTLLLFLAPVLFAQSDSKFSIQGRIIDDINHTGVARAKLTLKGSGSKELTAISADNGGFSFPDLGAGSYRLSIEKAGFFPQPYEDAIDVGNTPRTELGDIAIVTQRTISGIVRWADGEPAAGANGGVAAVQVKGRAKWTPVQEGRGSGTQRPRRVSYYWSASRTLRALLGAGCAGYPSRSESCRDERILSGVGYSKRQHHC